MWVLFKNSGLRWWITAPGPSWKHARRNGWKIFQNLYRHRICPDIKIVFQQNCRKLPKKNSSQINTKEREFTFDWRVFYYIIQFNCRSEIAYVLQLKTNVVQLKDNKISEITIDPIKLDIKVEKFENDLKTKVMQVFGQKFSKPATVRGLRV